MNSAQHAVWWIKKDFRLHDNPALTEALDRHEHVVALYCMEPGVLAQPETSAFHVEAWREALHELRIRLEAAGGALLCVHGEVCDALSALAEQRPFDALYSHQETGTLYTYGRDLQVAEWCESHHVDWREHRQTAVFRRLKDRDARASMWRAFMEEPALARPSSTGKTRASRRLRRGVRGRPGSRWSMRACDVPM